MKKTLMVSVLAVVFATTTFAQVELDGGSDIGSHSIELELKPTTNLLIINAGFMAKGCSAPTVTAQLEQLTEAGNEFTVKLFNDDASTKAEVLNDVRFHLNEIEKTLKQKPSFNIYEALQARLRAPKMTCASFSSASDDVILKVNQSKTGSKIKITGLGHIQVSVIEATTAQ